MSNTPTETPPPGFSHPSESGAHKALNITSVHESPEYIIMSMPSADYLLADDTSGALHIGALTTLLDSAMGFSVRTRNAKPMAIATLDLKVDNIRPSRRGAEIKAKASCFMVSEQVAYTRATAYEDDENDPVAVATGTFMLNTPGPVFEEMFKQWANVSV